MRKNFTSFFNWKIIAILLLIPFFQNLTAQDFCKTVNLPLPNDWTLKDYLLGPDNTDGYVNGTNIYLDKEKAMFFDASTDQQATYLTKVLVKFSNAGSDNGDTVVNINIYDGSFGKDSEPGDLLGSATAKMSQIIQDVNNNRDTEFFLNTPIVLPDSKQFFVSVDFSNLRWNNFNHDSLAVKSNTNGESMAGLVWEKRSYNQWMQYGESVWGIDISLLIHPYLTNRPAVAVISNNTDKICDHNYIDFDATGSSTEEGVEWIFDGGIPATSTNIKQRVTYNTAGNFSVRLIAKGGACSGGKTETFKYISVGTLKPYAPDNQEFFSGQTLQSLTVYADNPKWYANEADGTAHTNPIPKTTALVNATTYYVTETSDGCESAPTAVTVKEKSLGTSNVGKSMLSIYPNPVKDIINFNTDQQIDNVEIYSLDGKKAFSQSKLKNNKVDVKQIVPGTYILKAKSNSNEITIKFIKQ